MQEPTTSKEKEELEELRKHKASEEKFLAFASKKYPIHPTYSEYIEEQKHKKHKSTHSAVLNRRTTTTRKTLKLMTPTDQQTHPSANHPDLHMKHTTQKTDECTTDTHTQNSDIPKHQLTRQQQQYA
jgi:hypothetical protein